MKDGFGIRKISNSYEIPFIPEKMKKNPLLLFTGKFKIHLCGKNVWWTSWEMQRKTCDVILSRISYFFFLLEEMKCNLVYVWMDNTVAATLFLFFFLFIFFYTYISFESWVLHLLFSTNVYWIFGTKCAFFIFDASVRKKNEERERNV